MRMLLATAVAFILIAPATAAAQGPPTVTTGAAQPGTMSATLNGTIDPNGATTSYRFEYGTTTAYGLQSPTQPAGSGDAELPVQATISGLTASTTYHYRLVAFPEGADRVNGIDRTFTTTVPNPAAPSISRLSAVDKTPTSARLTARIDPNRAATTWHIEWGTTTSLGRTTPEQTIPTGDGAVQISVPLDSLPAHTKIYWRVVASNAAGLRRSGIASFTTLRAPTGITLSVFPETTPWSGNVLLSGRVEGSGVNGLSVALEQWAFPYSTGFEQIATVRTGGRGEFRFPSRTLLIATRFRAVTRTTVSVTSGVVGANVRARVGIRRTARTRRALRLTGRVQPGLPAGRATLQRRTRSGGWTFVRRKALDTASTTESTYRFRVRRLRRAAVYRVKVSANDGGAHLGSTSRALLVGKKRKR
jgi:hypothetical protein